MLLQRIAYSTYKEIWLDILVGPQGSPGFPVVAPHTGVSPGSKFSWLPVSLEHFLFSRPLPTSTLIL